MKFLRKNPLISNILLMIAVSIAIVIILLLGLGHYTKHGDAVIVPPLQGLSWQDAEAKLKAQGLRGEVVDSNYYEHLTPGSVYESLPEAGAKVKPGRIIFLTVNATSPKLVQLPSNLEGMSMRQAKATLEGLGFRIAQIRQVPGEFEGLTVGVEDTKGLSLAPGTKLEAQSSLVLLVTGNTPLSLEDLSTTPDQPVMPEETPIPRASPEEEESWW